jgi:hypothetical protein
MERAGVEERRRAAAEAAALVEIVETGDAVLAVALFVEHQPHGYAHPEELRGLDAARGLPRLVDDQVAIVERLDAEEVELEVGRRVERGGQLGEIVVEQARVEALDGDAVLEVLLEGALVGRLQGADAVAT